MLMTDRVLGIIKLVFGVGALLYLFLILMIMPILPVEENIFERYMPVEIILLGSGIFGLLFMGSLSIFTLTVLYRHKQKIKLS